MTGRLFIPLSKWAWVAILIFVVLMSHQRMLRVAFGTHPRKMPLWELGPGGQTQTRQPEVQTLEKSSCLPVARAIGDCDQDGSGGAFDMQSA